MFLLRAVRHWDCAGPQSVFLRRQRGLQVYFRLEGNLLLKKKKTILCQNSCQYLVCLCGRLQCNFKWNRGLCISQGTSQLAWLCFNIRIPLDANGYVLPSRWERWASISVCDSVYLCVCVHAPAQNNNNSEIANMWTNVEDTISGFW